MAAGSEPCQSPKAWSQLVPLCLSEFLSKIGTHSVLASSDIMEKNRNPHWQKCHFLFGGKLLFPLCALPVVTRMLRTQDTYRPNSPYRHTARYSGSLPLPPLHIALFPAGSLSHKTQIRPLVITPAFSLSKIVSTYTHTKSYITHSSWL